jgi:uncharacterized protein (TIGR00290 family)
VLHELREAGSDVTGLLWLSNGCEERFRISREIVEAQARLCGLPILAVMAPLVEPARTVVVRQAYCQAASAGADSIAFGHFQSRARPRIEKRLDGTGLRGVFPLWGRRTSVVAREMLASGLEALVLSVDTRVLPSSIVGRRFDRDLVEEVVQLGADPCGEGGVFNTVAIAGPMFKQRLRLDTEVVGRGSSAAHLHCRLS